MRWSWTAKWVGAVILGGAAGVAACNAVLDTGKFTYGSCETKGERRCVNNALEVCSAEGTWAAEPACQNKACDADAGKCVGDCAPSSGQCNPDGSPSIQTCDLTGHWQDSTSLCPQHSCVENECRSCVRGTTSCNETTDPNSIQPDASGPSQLLCDEHGVYQILMPCNCVHGKCKDCLPGETSCLGPLERTCDDGGSWPDAVPCASGLVCDPSAGVGHCVQPCTKNSTRCNDQEAQTCNDAGTWETTEVCQPPCKPCGGTGKCTPQVAGTPCDGGCIIDGTCQNGACVASPGGEVQCVGGDGPCNLMVCDNGSCVAPQGTGCNVGLCLDGGSECNNGTCDYVDHSWAHWSFFGLADPSGSRFVVTNQVVYDTASKLMWQRKPADAAFDFTHAQSYCECLNDSTSTNCEHIDGYPSGWRVPTRIELASIVLYASAATSTTLIDLTSFDLPNVGSDAGSPANGDFWTISTQAGATYNGWQVNFVNGFVHPVSILQKALVRCVR